MRLFLLLCTLALASGQGFTNPKKPAAVGRKEDVQYIKCQACEALAKNALRQVKAAREGLKPGKKLDEMTIIEKVEKMTNPSKDEGEWIAKTDIEEEGPTLKLVEHSEVGECNSDCKTIAKAVEAVIGDSDTDIAEELWKGTKNRSQFTNWLCHKQTGSCRSKPPPVPADRKPGPAFKVMDAQEAQMQKMMDNMKEMGMGGQLWDRDSAMQEVAKGELGDDYDDDEIADLLSSGPPKVNEGPGVLDKASDLAQDVIKSGKDKLSAAYSGAADLLSGWGAGEKPADAATSEL